MTDDDQRLAAAPASGFRVSEGLTIAAAPAFGYALAWVYETGYLASFGIPREFVSVGLAQVVGATFAVTAASLLTVALLNALYAVARAIKYPGCGSFFLLGAQISFGWAVIGARGFDYRDLVLWGGATLLMVFYLVIWPLFAYREHAKGRWLRVYLHQEMIFKTRLGVRAPPLALTVLFMFTAAASMGRTSASDREEFITLEDSPDLLLVRDYGGEGLFVRFDRASMTIRRSLVVKKLAGDQSGLAFRTERLGTLRLAGIREDQNSPQREQPAIRPSPTGLAAPIESIHAEPTIH